MWNGAILRTIIKVGVLLILIANILHAFWNLSFTNSASLLIAKIALLIVFIVPLLRDKLLSGIRIELQRVVLIVAFCLLLGIQKADVGSWIAPGKYEIAATYTKELINWDELQDCIRIEYLYMEYGMHNAKFKYELVTPLFFGLEWRRVIAYHQDDYPEFAFYKLHTGYYP
jgi:hypothetical protein